MPQSLAAFVIAIDDGSVKIPGLRVSEKGIEDGVGVLAPMDLDAITAEAFNQGIVKPRTKWADARKEVKAIRAANEESATADKAIKLAKYSEDQPRDENGRWTSDGDEPPGGNTFYHGTNSDGFTEFDPSKKGSATDEGLLGSGYYFSTDPNVARNRSTIIAAHLNVEKPLDVKYPKWGADKNKLVNEAIGTSGLKGEELTRELQERGYDSVRLDYSPVGYQHTEVAVFDPSRIDTISATPHPHASAKANRYGRHLAKRLMAPTIDSPIVAQARTQLQATLAHFFKTEASAIRAKLEAQFGAKKLAKADGTPESIHALASRLVDEIDWDPVIPEIARSLKTISVDRGVSAFHRVTSFAETLGKATATVRVQDPITLVSDDAADWASAWAAELVGKKYNAAGELVENPDARWSIAETTRENLNDVITDAFEEETWPKELADRIAEAGPFSEARAATIARTETARAQTQGDLIGWRQSGVVQQVEILLSDDHDDDDECDAAEDENPYDIEDAPEVPIHPNCSCSLAPYFEDQHDEDDDDEG